MSVATFEESLSDLAECHRVPPAEVSDIVGDLIEPPAVGVPLPFESVTLPDTVTTEFSADDLRVAETGVTPVGLGVAEYGTVTVRSTGGGDELVSLYAPRHVAVLHAEDVVPDATTAYERLSEEFAAGRDTQVLATGPSATADMGDLVTGVHGPEDVIVVVIDP